MSPFDPPENVFRCSQGDQKEKLGRKVLRWLFESPDNAMLDLADEVRQASTKSDTFYFQWMKYARKGRIQSTRRYSKRSFGNGVVCAGYNSLNNSSYINFGTRTSNSQQNFLQSHSRRCFYTKSVDPKSRCFKILKAISWWNLVSGYFHITLVPQTHGS